jgi:phage repressor protein C with HTH and peptisase S24 domain
MVIGERVRERLAAAGLTQSELARRLHITQGTIAKLASGVAQGSTHLHRIARELQTTPAYLTGESDDPTVDALPLPTPELIAEQLDQVMLPRLEIGYSMGGGSVFEDYHEVGRMPFPREWLRPLMRGSFAELFLAKGEGDSMMPTLLDGDDVIIDTAQKQISQQDRIWAVAYGDLGMIKRVRRLPGGTYQLNSDNPAVTPIEANDDEMHVVGRVVWVGRKI